MPLLLSTKACRMKDDILEKILDETGVVSDYHDGSLDVRELLKVLSLVKSGKLNVRMPVTQAGINGRICEVLNDIIDMNERFMGEISTAETSIGKRGNLSKRIELREARGQWASGDNSLNNQIKNLRMSHIQIRR